MNILKENWDQNFSSHMMKLMILKFLDNLEVFNEDCEDLGDFQTPIHLTNKICKYLLNQGFSPDIIFEPTVGRGNFVISAINTFNTLQFIYSVDIQRKYDWLFKLNILKLSNEKEINIVETEFHRDNIFHHQLSSNFKKFLDTNCKSLLILGNPPWVTNTKLSTLNSKNLPTKSNIKGLNGIDAITGKSNFDIAEFILLSMINLFSNRECKIAMLCKTSVVKNLVKDMKRLSLNLSDIKSLVINSKRIWY